MHRNRLDEAALRAANDALAEAAALARHDEAGYFEPALSPKASGGRQPPDPQTMRPPRFTAQDAAQHHARDLYQRSFHPEADASGSPAVTPSPLPPQADASGSPAVTPSASSVLPPPESDADLIFPPLPFHPLADAFPLLPQDELAELAADIKRNGLQEPIVMAEGMIADGRNRYLACQLARVDPRYVDFEGPGSLAAFVISRNLRRRHLDASQRAMVASRLARLEKGANQFEQKEDGEISPSTSAAMTQPQAAELLNVSRDLVKFARQLEKHGDRSLVAAVEAGEVSVSDAAAVVDRPPDVQRAALEAKRSGRAKTVRQAAAQIGAGTNAEPTADDLPTLHQKFDLDFGRTIRGFDVIARLQGPQKQLDRVRIGLNLAKAAMVQFRRETGGDWRAVGGGWAPRRLGRR